VRSRLVLGHQCMEQPDIAPDPIMDGMFVADLARQIVETLDLAHVAIGAVQHDFVDDGSGSDSFAYPPSFFANAKARA
jgi:hypothetical protein